MKPTHDTITISFRVSPAEHLRYFERTRELDLTISDWLRMLARRDAGLWMPSGEKLKPKG